MGCGLCWWGVSRYHEERPYGIVQEDDRRDEEHGEAEELVELWWVS